MIHLAIQTRDDNFAVELVQLAIKVVFIYQVGTIWTKTYKRSNQSGTLYERVIIPSKKYIFHVDESVINVEPRSFANLKGKFVSGSVTR